MDDLDDLIDDVMGSKPTTTAQRHKSSAMGKFGAKKDDLDDLGDSFNFDEVLGVGGQPKKPTMAKSGSY